MCKFILYLSVIKEVISLLIHLFLYFLNSKDLLNYICVLNFSIKGNLYHSKYLLKGGDGHIVIIPNETSENYRLESA